MGKLCFAFLLLYSSICFGQLDMSIGSGNSGHANDCYDYTGIDIRSHGYPVSSLEELYRLEIEYQESLRNREAEFQEIIDRARNAHEYAREQVGREEKPPRDVPSFPVSEEQAQVNRLVQKFDRKRLESLVHDFQFNRDYKFSTEIGSAEGQNLNAVLEYRNRVASKLDSSDSKYVDKLYLLDSSDNSLSVADLYYQEGDKSSAQMAIDVAIGLIDIAVSFLPGVSWGRDLYEAFTGKDLVYGNTLGTLERSFAILGVSTIGVGSSVKKGMKILSEIATTKLVLNADKYKNAFSHAEVAVKVANQYVLGVSKHIKDVTKNLKASSDKSFSHILYPRGAGASSGAVPNGYTKVSRWMSDAEVKAWYSGGGTRIPPGLGANERLYVTKAGAAKPGGTGSVRVDFHVPENMLQRAGKNEWHQILQPEANKPIYNVEIFLPEVF